MQQEASTLAPVLHRKNQQSPRSKGKELPAIVNKPKYAPDPINEPSEIPETQDEYRHTHLSLSSKA